MGEDSRREPVAAPAGDGETSGTGSAGRAAVGSPGAATLSAAEAEGIDPVMYGRRWSILASLCVSLLAVMLANSSLNLALPAMAVDLSLTTLQQTWVVEAYALVFTGLLFIAGAVGDRYGRKRVMQGGLVLFTASSLYAGLVAGSGAEVIVARLLAGLGAAMVMPTTLSLLNVTFLREERAKAIAIWSGIAGAGVAFGSVVSGFLLEHFAWQSVFLFSGVVAVGALVANQVLSRESRDEHQTPIDWVGGGLVAGGLVAMVYGIMEAPSHGLTPAVTAALVAGVVLLVAFVRWELRSPNPMLDMRLFRRPAFSVSSLSVTLAFLAMAGVMYAVGLMFQLVMGYSPLRSAAGLLPILPIMLVAAPFIPRLVKALGIRRAVGSGLALVAAGFFLMALWPTQPSYLQVFLPMLVLIIGMSVAVMPATEVMMSSVPRNRSGMGSAMNDTTRELGTALGVAVLGALIASGYAENVAGAVAELPVAARDLAEGSLSGALTVAGMSGDAALAAVATAAWMDGLGVAVLVAGGITLLAALIAVVGLPRQVPPADPVGSEGAPLVTDASAHTGPAPRLEPATA